MAVFENRKKLYHSTLALLFQSGLVPSAPFRTVPLWTAHCTVILVHFLVQCTPSNYNLFSWEASHLCIKYEHMNQFYKVISANYPLLYYGINVNKMWPNKTFSTDIYCMYTFISAVKCNNFKWISCLAEHKLCDLTA